MIYPCEANEVHRSSKSVDTCWSLWSISFEVMKLGNKRKSSSPWLTPDQNYFVSHVIKNCHEWSPTKVVVRPIHSKEHGKRKLSRMRKIIIEYWLSGVLCVQHIGFMDRVEEEGVSYHLENNKSKLFWKEVNCLWISNKLFPALVTAHTALYRFEGSGWERDVLFHPLAYGVQVRK